ncbi:MAG: hypothetical protein ACRCXC_02780 [Legionella sp.]
MNNHAYFGGTFCNSGALLIDEVLERFNMSTTIYDYEIKEIAIGLCVESQNALLVSALQKEKLDLEAEKRNLAGTTETQQQTIEELRVQLQKTELQES